MTRPRCLTYAFLMPFLLGMFSLAAFLSACIVAIQWDVANRPVFAPAPVLAQAADGAYTAGSALEDEVTRCEGWFHESIDADVPFGLRWVAHKMARWSIRTTFRHQIAAHGHQVAPILRAIEPEAHRFVKQEVADGLTRARVLAETPIEELGVGAANIRAQSGEPVSVNSPY